MDNTPLVGFTLAEGVFWTEPGGLPTDRIERIDHQLEPWEKLCRALADVLDFHKIIDTEEKRRVSRRSMPRS